MTFDTYLRHHSLTWHQWDAKPPNEKDAYARGWLDVRFDDVAASPIVTAPAPAELTPEQVRDALVKLYPEVARSIRRKAVIRRRLDSARSAAWYLLAGLAAMVVMVATRGMWG